MSRSRGRGRHELQSVSAGGASAPAPPPPGRLALGANGLALVAIALWATLASLGVALAHVPPFLLTGLALVVGSAPAWPLVARWRVPPATLALGVYGLFGFHLLLFLALRHAPPIEANVVNYLWPLLIVVLAPLLLPGVRTTRLHVAAALVGCAGAVLAITGGRTLSGDFAWGYVLALGSAVVWATYSLGTKRVAPFPTAAVGLFALVSGLLALACHAALEPSVALSGRDWLLVADAQRARTPTIAAATTRAPPTTVQTPRPRPVVAARSSVERTGVAYASVPICRASPRLSAASQR